MDRPDKVKEIARLSASISIMFKELPFTDRFAAARDAGFSAVEIQNIAEAGPNEIRIASERSNMPILLINVPSSDFAEGGPGLSGVPGREKEFSEAFSQAARVAEESNVPFIHIAPSRLSPEAGVIACRRVYLSNVRRALDRVASSSIMLLIEALNRRDAPGALFNDIDDVAALLDEAKCGSGLGMLFDCYHVAMNDQDPEEKLARYYPWVRHIQFSDAPGRHQPGTGSIPFDTFLRKANDLGYSGHFGAEYHPSGTTMQSLSWMPSFKNALLK